MNIEKAIKGALVALALTGVAVAVTATTATAANIVGVQVGPVGLGFTVNNAHYYDRHHRRKAYSYPSDWQTYHHPKAWYYSHRQWNNEKHRDYYRH